MREFSLLLLHAIIIAFLDMILVLLLKLLLSLLRCLLRIANFHGPDHFLRLQSPLFLLELCLSLSDHVFGLSDIGAFLTNETLFGAHLAFRTISLSTLDSLHFFRVNLSLALISLQLLKSLLLLILDALINRLLLSLG